MCFGSRDLSDFCILAHLGPKYKGLVVSPNFYGQFYHIPLSPRKERENRREKRGIRSSHFHLQFVPADMRLCSVYCNTFLILAAAAAGDGAAAAGDGAAAAAAAAGDGAAAGTAVGAAAKKKEKKRKPQFSPNPNEDLTSPQEEKDDSPTGAAVDIVPPTPPPEGLLSPSEGLISPTETLTFEELEAMHNEIVQKCAPLIDGINALNIFGLAWVEHCHKHKLKEHKMRESVVYWYSI